MSAILRELGDVVIDADQLARDVVQPGEPALADIAREFGQEMLKADGSLDRKALGAVVKSGSRPIAGLQRDARFWKEQSTLTFTADAAKVLDAALRMPACDRDLFAVEPAQLLEAEVDLTLVGGEVRHDRLGEL